MTEVTELMILALVGGSIAPYERLMGPKQQDNLLIKGKWNG